MAVKIRFSRIGKKHAPFYRIVATDEREKRDGEVLENLGTYDPRTKQFPQIHVDRIEYWLGKGAVPTPVIKKLYKLHLKTSAAATV
ncbi:TPA: 30S ribosomal protein S16 [Candidatus Dependentiae bacterium]|nr:MAG: 30S ribosomal protein S16 [candidate division TM6 bacterium GW2011_GWF2_43_87]HBL98488.1 30S ribosomal protein S16 [Candidatus Dependentiae bacterium]